MAEAVEVDYRFFHRYRYGLVDASRREDVPDIWKARVVAPAFLGEDTGRSPVLVDFLAIPKDDRFALVDRLSHETNNCSDDLLSLALESDASPERLVPHLAERLAIRTGGQRPPMQFRYYDPGTFIQLPTVLGTKGMRWLFGPIAAVAVPWCHEWRRYPRPDTEAPTFYSAQRVLPSLQRLGVINRVLMQLPNIRSQDDWCARASTTAGYVSRAETRHGLSVRDDLVAFALHAWRCHPEFDNHPIIQNLFLELAKATPEDELDYRELTARLETADWQRIADDLTTQTKAQGRTR